MKYTSRKTSPAARPEWTYSVQTPARFSLVWILGHLASLGIPIAGLALLVILAALGVFQQP